MPNFEIAVDAVEAVAESNLTQRIATHLVQAAQDLFKTSADAQEAVGAIARDSDLTVASGVDASFVVNSTSSKPMQELIETYKGVIPETMQSSTILRSDAPQISSILFPERTRQLALSIQDASKAWSAAETVRFNPRVDGKVIMPFVNLSTERASRGALGSYSDTTAKLGEDVFATAFSPKNTAVAVHEITHHEQGFLRVCRQADQLGIGCGKLTPDQISTITDRLGPGANFKASSLQRFMTFRNGRPLTAEAAERAEKLQQSHNDLFSRPIVGAAIRNRVYHIDSMQSTLENPTKLLDSRKMIHSLYDPEEGNKLFNKFIVSDKDGGAVDDYAVDNARQSLLSRMPKTQLSKWTDADYANAQAEFSSVLDQSHLHALRLQRGWSNAYNNSLHEQEAKFNEFIAAETMKKLLGSTSKQALPAYGNLEIY